MALRLTVANSRSGPGNQRLSPLACPWNVLWAVWQATDAQLEAESQARNLEGELRLVKDLCCPLLC